MHYNIDLRQKAISAIGRGESKTSVARMFGLDRKTIYNWLARKNLAPNLAKTRLSKVDPAKLKALVEATPDARLVDFAQTLGVSINAVHYQLKKMNMRKKNHPLRRTKVYGTH